MLLIRIQNCFGSGSRQKWKKKHTSKLPKIQIFVSVYCSFVNSFIQCMRTTMILSTCNPPNFRRVLSYSLSLLYLIEISINIIATMAKIDKPPLKKTNDGKSALVSQKKNVSTGIVSLVVILPWSPSTPFNRVVPIIDGRFFRRRLHCCCLRYQSHRLHCRWFQTSRKDST